MPTLNESSGDVREQYEDHKSRPSHPPPPIACAVERIRVSAEFAAGLF